MTTSQLVGKRVALMISDPWDFGTDCGVGPFRGKIVDFDKERILVKFGNVIEYSNVCYFSSICQIRHEDFSLSDLLEGIAISVNMILLPIQASLLVDIVEGDFRKGFAAIGSVELLNRLFENDS